MYVLGDLQSVILFVYPISGQCSLSIPPDNVMKPLVL